MTITIVHGKDDALIAQCRAIREEVFIVEQSVPVAEEWDDKDAEATHFVLQVDGVPMGTGRLRILGPKAKFERFAIRKQARGTGAGAQLMQAMMVYAQAQPGVSYGMLSGQVQAIPFYEKQGFTCCSEIYMDAGIPHRDMQRVF